MSAGRLAIELIFDVAFVAIGYWWGRGSRRHTWLVLVEEGAGDDRGQ